MDEKMKKRRKKKKEKKEVNIDKFLTNRNMTIMAICTWLIPSPLSK